jgi:hypothetical protein
MKRSRNDRDRKRSARRKSRFQCHFSTLNPTRTGLEFGRRLDAWAIQRPDHIKSVKSNQLARNLLTESSSLLVFSIQPSLSHVASFSLRKLKSNLSLCWIKHHSVGIHTTLDTHPHTNTYNTWEISTHTHTSAHTFFSRCPSIVSFRPQAPISNYIRSTYQ